MYFSNDRNVIGNNFQELTTYCMLFTTYLTESEFQIPNPAVIFTLFNLFLIVSTICEKFGIGELCREQLTELSKNWTRGNTLILPYLAKHPWLSDSSLHGRSGLCQIIKATKSVQNSGIQQTRCHMRKERFINNVQ